MVILGVLGALLLGMVVGIAITAKAVTSQFKVKGSFIVRGYKNGELTLVREFVDEVYIAGPGDKYDKIEIIG